MLYRMVAEIPISGFAIAQQSGQDFAEGAQKPEVIGQLLELPGVVLAVEGIRQAFDKWAEAASVYHGFCVILLKEGTDL